MPLFGLLQEKYTVAGRRHTCCMDERAEACRVERYVANLQNTVPLWTRTSSFAPLPISI